MTAQRTAEDARYRPTVGDKYYFLYLLGYLEIVEITAAWFVCVYGGSRSVVSRSTWAIGPGRWEPAAGDTE